MAVEDVASRAEAYGFWGHVVSGNDLLAVVQLSERVMNRVREGRRSRDDRVQDLPLSRP